MSTTKDAALVKKLRSTAPQTFAGYPVLFAYLYGSYATGCTHPYSDMDIAVYLKPQSAKKALDIELDLSLALDKALDHKIETEVRALNNLPLTFAGRIITEGLLLYCRDESERVEFEVQIRKKYFDFLPVIEQYHQEYLNKVRQ
ncbi:MAG: type VII toxin-antitoxin system MntA family adenylyltransferase antitoxin [Desulfosalsimonas sp.]